MKRSLLASMLGTLALLAVGALVRPVGAQTRSDFVHHRHVFARLPDGASVRLLVSFPRREDGRDFPRDVRLPVLIALHGAREAELQEGRAVLAWSIDYHLDEAFGALARGRLNAADYGRLVRDGHLRTVNEALRARPFRGLVVVTPLTPNLLAERVGSEALRAFADKLAGPVLATVREQFPVATGREGTGIDGVSLGGRLALEVGFARPDVFGVVGAMQPALQPDQVDALASRAAAARRQGLQTIRLLTSDGDGGRAQCEALSTALRRRRVAHELVTTPGEHGYEFNRGPGALEMLLFHDRSLVGPAM